MPRTSPFPCGRCCSDAEHFLAASAPAFPDGSYEIPLEHRLEAATHEFNHPRLGIAATNKHTTPITTEEARQLLSLLRTASAPAGTPDVWLFTHKLTGLRSVYFHKDGVDKARAYLGDEWTEATFFAAPPAVEASIAEQIATDKALAQLPRRCNNTVAVGERSLDSCVLLDGHDGPCAAAVEARETGEPVAWVIPGDDNARFDGWLDAKAWREGEFTRPLYAAPPPEILSLRAEVERVTGVTKVALEALADQRKTIDAMAMDSARLDWLEKLSASIAPINDGSRKGRYFTVCGENDEFGKAYDLRAAIDAARSPETGDQP
jgi:hypothetical protein